MLFLPGCPQVSVAYQTREAQALGQSFAAIEAGRVDLPDPWTGEMRSTGRTSGLLDPEILGGLYFAPLVYRLGAGEREFWAVSCDLTGRIVHLYLPALDLVVYEVDEARSVTLDRGLRGAVDDLRRRPAEPSEPGKIVAVIDMVRNYGHQMLHHLSGLDLLIDYGLHAKVDEIWLAGTSFFGPVETLYPEVAGKIRRFTSRVALGEALLAEPVVAVRIGANCFFEATRRRILARAASKRAFLPKGDRRPLIAVTVRSINRRCLNLDEVVRGVWEGLRPDYPDLAFVVDGWVFAEGDIVGASNAATCLDPPNAGRMQTEFMAARAAFRLIPPEAVVRNVIGTSILESIAGLADVDAYLAHVGTLQHKIAFPWQTGGVVHGPTSQIRHIDSGSFQAEGGKPPLYCEPGMIEDAPGTATRGAANSDYRIIDIGGVVAKLRSVIAAG